MTGSAALVPVLVGLFGSTGFAGIIITLLKMRGDRDNAAVSQATGANEALVSALHAVESERDYWRSRFHELERENAELRSRLAT